MRYVLLLLLALALVLCACSSETTRVDAAKVASIEVRPSSVLLPSADAERSLRVVALDANGNELEGKFDVTWETVSGPFQVEGGVLTSSDVGSGRVRATVGEHSAIAWAASTRVKPGVKLVDDEQILGAIEDISADAETGHYQVRLEGSFAAGDLVLGTGEAPVMGEVTRVDGQTIRLQLVPLERLFDDYRIEENFAPEDLELELAEGYNAVETENGYRVEYTGSGEGLVQQPLGPQGTRALGPFGCDETVQFPITFQANPSFDVTPNVSAKISASLTGGFQHFIVEGGVETNLAFKPRLNAAVEGKITCKVEIGQVVVPIGGPLSLVFGGFVPFGVGLELSAKVDAEVGADLQIEAEATVTAGVACDIPGNAECQLVTELETSQERTFKWVTPGEGDFTDLELGAFAFGFIEFGAGTPLVRALEIKIAEGRLGLNATADLGTKSAQLNDPEFAATSKLDWSRVLSAGLGVDLFGNLVSITIIKAEAKAETTLLASPRGSSSVDAARVTAGDDITGTIELAETSLFGVFDDWLVDAVYIYRKTDTDYERVFSSTNPTFEDNLLDWSWTTSEADIGNHTLVATTVWELLPGLEFEVENDSSLQVEVAEAGSDFIGTYAGQCEEFEDPDYVGPPQDCWFTLEELDELTFRIRFSHQRTSLCGGMSQPGWITTLWDVPKAQMSAIPSPIGAAGQGGACDSGGTPETIFDNPRGTTSIDGGINADGTVSLRFGRGGFDVVGPSIKDYMRSIDLRRCSEDILLPSGETLPCMP